MHLRNSRGCGDIIVVRYSSCLVGMLCFLHIFNITITSCNLLWHLIVFIELLNWFSHCIIVYVAILACYESALLIIRVLIWFCLIFLGIDLEHLLISLRGIIHLLINVIWTGGIFTLDCFGGWAHILHGFC